MCKLLDQAANEKMKLVVFPGLAFTTFFPRYLFQGPDMDQYFNIQDPSKGGIEQS